MPEQPSHEAWATKTIAIYEDFADNKLTEDDRLDLISRVAAMLRAAIRAAEAPLRAERDATVADNAALIKVLLNNTYYHHDGYTNIPWADECPACSGFNPKDDHPGAALLAAFRAERDHLVALAWMMATALEDVQRIHGETIESVAKALAAWRETERKEPSTNG